MVTVFLVFSTGVFLWQLGVCTRDRGSALAEGGREKVLEKTLLPAPRVRNLLCTQRQSQGQLCVCAFRVCVCVWVYLRVFVALSYRL